MREPRVGDLVKIERCPARVLRVDRQRQTLDALLTRKTNVISYVGRPWHRVELDKE